VTATTIPRSGYVFADDPARGAVHHATLVQILAQVLDPFTAWRLAPHIGPDSRCLEVAAGAGSIAGWMADRAGHVVATDTDITHLSPHPNLTPLRHNLVTDPVEGAFDVIHARLVLAHLPQRHELLGKLAAALNPRGVLVVEEFQPGWDWCLLDAPDIDEAQRLLAGYQQALTAVLQQAGADTGWGRNVHRSMRAHDLVDIDVQLWARSWYGGQPGCLLPATAAAQLRPKLVAAGMSQADIDALRGLLMEPALMMHASLAVSTIGHHR